MLHGPSLTVAGHEASTTGSSTARAKHVKKKRKKAGMAAAALGRRGRPRAGGRVLAPGRAPTQADAGHHANRAAS